VTSQEVVDQSLASASDPPSRFSLQQFPHAFYVELFDTVTPRHLDLLATTMMEGRDIEHR
jgi:hypothetical protein